MMINLLSMTHLDLAALLDIVCRLAVWTSFRFLKSDKIAALVLADPGGEFESYAPFGGDSNVDFNGD
jgi:hypothetical protein